MSFITGSLFFTFGAPAILYSYFQVLRVEKGGGSGNAQVFFTDGTTLTMTIIEAKEIFGLGV